MDESTAGTTTVAGPAQSAGQARQRPPRRHQLIVGGCFVLAAAAFGVSAFDLSLLIKTEVTIDRDFKVTGQKLPELPSDCTVVSYRTAHEGLIAVCQSTWNKQLIGFADSQGNIVIKPQFVQANDFHDGLAAVEISKPDSSLDWAYIDKTGKIVIEADFNNPTDFEQGTAIVSGESDRYIIDRTGRTVFKLDQYASEDPVRVGSNYAIKDRSDRIGLIDKSGKWLIKPRFDRLDPLTADNEQHNLCLPSLTAPENCNQREAEYWLVTERGKQGVIDAQGKFVLPLKVQHVVAFANGHAKIEENNLFGFADQTGRTVIPARFLQVTPFAPLIAVRENCDDWSLIDSSGTPVKTGKVTPILDYRGDWFKDGRAAVLASGGQCGYLDSHAHFAIPAKFKYASTFEEGYAAVFDGKNWRFIDTNGKYASPLRFACVSPFFQGEAQATLAGPLYSFVESNTVEENLATLKNLESQGQSFDNSNRAEAHSFGGCIVVQ